jgi:CheY-like chemotaxis protein
MPSVVAVVDDLFFVSKLQETARLVGAQLATVRAAAFHLDDLRQQKPALVIFDLNTTSGNAAELIRQLKNDAELKEIPVMAFFSHVQVELQRAAQEAGCDQILPRSQFTATLPQLLRQFAPGAQPTPAS